MVFGSSEKQNYFLFLLLISLCEKKRGKGKIEEFKFCTREDLGVFCPCAQCIIKPKIEQ